MSETDENSPNRVVRKRKDKSGKSGAPKLQNYTKLTEEMEDVAQLTSAGFAITEIADKLKIRTEKVKIYVDETPIVKARIDKLVGDKYTLWGKLNDRLYVALIEMLIEKSKQGKINFHTALAILARHDTAYGMMDKIYNPLLPIPAVGGKTQPQIEEKTEEATNIFGPKEIGETDGEDE